MKLKTAANLTLLTLALLFAFTIFNQSTKQETHTTQEPSNIATPQVPRNPTATNFNEPRILGASGITYHELVNATSAQSLGVKGYILERLTNYYGNITIPFSGTTTLTVELWFVSYDNKLNSTNVIISRNLSYRGTGEWTSYEASCMPNGNFWIRVDRPIVCKLTVWIPDYVGHNIVLNNTHSGSIIDIKSSYPILDSSRRLYSANPSITATPRALTTESAVTVSVFNPGYSTVTFGNVSSASKIANGSWTEIQTQEPWNYHLVSLRPGYTWRESLNVTGLDSGSYRFSQFIDPRGLAKEIDVMMNVSRPPEAGNGLPRWGIRYVCHMELLGPDFPGRPTLWVDNIGAQSVWVDDSYELLRFEGGVYRVFFVKVASVGSLKQLNSWSGEYELGMLEPSVLPAGDYRIIKNVGVEGTSAEKTLAVDFTWGG